MSCSSQSQHSQVLGKLLVRSFQHLLLHWGLIPWLCWCYCTWLRVEFCDVSLEKIQKFLSLSGQLMKKVFSTYLSDFLVQAGRSPQCCHPAIAKHWDNINLAVNCWSWARTALLKFSDAAVRNQLTDEYKYEVCFLLTLWWLMQRWLWAATMGGGTEQWGEQNPAGNLSCWHPWDFRWKWGLIVCIHD